MQPSTYSRRGHSLFSGRGFFINAAFVGNSGFDPLKIANAENLVPLRNAELKHGRLAMLAALGWPFQEILHPKLMEILRGFNAHNTLIKGCSPSIFNGGLNQPEVTSILALGFVIGVTFELKDIRIRAQKGLKFNEWALDSVAGDLRFDPLNIATDMPVTERFELQQAEMLNGRVAMLAVLCYAFIETQMHVPAVCFSPSMLSWTL